MKRVGEGSSYLWHVAGEPKQNTSVWLALRNPAFVGLWLPSVVSGVCVSAHDTAATWLMNALGVSSLLLSLIATGASLPGEKSIAGPMIGKSRPPKAGPRIPPRFICTPPRVMADASFSFWTISGTIDPHTGALNAKPIPSKKTVVRMR